jgi:hypothetical protein
MILFDGVDLDINQDGIESPIQVYLDEIFCFALYDVQSLQYVFNAIDEDPKQYRFIDVDEILNEIEAEGKYKDFIKESNGQIHRLFLEVFLGKVNKHYLTELKDENEKLTGEGGFLGMIVFNGEEDQNAGSEKRFIDLQSEIQDPDGLIQNALDEREWENEEDVFYVLKFSSHAI